MRWSGQARADLEAIHDVIARDSTHYARKVTLDLVENTDTLGELPRLGRVVPELGDDNVREIPAYSYRNISEIKPGDDVVVLPVIHKRRNLRPEEVR